MRLQSIKHLVNNNRLFFVNLILTAITALVVFVRRGHSDIRVMVWGVALQLIGVLTVWVGSIGRTYNETNKRLESASRRIQSVPDELNSKTKVETREYSRTIGDLSSSMDDLMSEDLSIVLSGVIWLAAGTVLVILAPEVVKSIAKEWPVISRAW